MTIPLSEFVTFIRSQPDDKPISMYESSYSTPCGCLMVQFGKHKELTFDKVGYTEIGDVATVGIGSNELTCQVRMVSYALKLDISTYKEAKEILNQLSL